MTLVSSHCVARGRKKEADVRATGPAYKVTTHGIASDPKPIVGERSPMPRPIYCPSCRREIRRDKIDAGEPFPCPSCGKLLRIRRYYYPVPGIGAFFACAALGYAFGLTGFSLLIFVAVLWAPITVFLFAIMKLKFNPKIEQIDPKEFDIDVLPKP